MPKPYPEEFRQDVVRVARNRGPGVTVEQVATDFGVHPMTLWKWMRRADIDDGTKAGTSSGRNLEAFRRHGIPFIVVDRVAEGADQCSVSVDDVVGGALAVHHLIDAGHRSIGYVSGPEELSQVMSPFVV